MRPAIQIVVVVAKKSILFIINPKSGVQSKKRLPELIDKHIDRSRYDYAVEFTSYAGHASEIASKAAADGVYAAVAVGGDGTVNEVACGIVHTGTSLGVIPCGSGNGFARHLGVPVDAKGAIDFINRAEPVAVDYGKINGKPFFCSCGVGFDALVSSDFARAGSRGPVTYVQKALADWVDYMPELYEVQTAYSNREYKAFLIACGNASQYGNNAYIAPYASMRDGMLSVSVLLPFTTLEVPHVAAQLFSNTLSENSRMVTLNTPRLTIRRASAGPAHYDGEPVIMDKELNIEAVPGGLMVLSCPGWDGTCEPVPLYRQLLDAVMGNV